MKAFAYPRSILFCIGLAYLSLATGASAEVRLHGSGASFPFPIYAKWFKDFSAANRGIRVDYQAKGSGAGIRDFTNEVVDFAGSDAAMNDDEIAKVKNGVVLLPMTAGEIVLTYNLKGVKDLKLPRDVYADIFMGKIDKWNDARIVAANPGVKLPGDTIRVVVRSDSSGTTYVFTGHLSTISEDFKKAIGQGKAPQWPGSSNFVKSPKNDGITATVRQTPGAIGYIEYGYAKLTKSPVASLENKSGKFVSPGPGPGAAALSSTEFPSGNLPGSEVRDLRGWNYDPSAPEAYPIASFTWLMFPTNMGAERAEVAHKLIEYCLTTGQESADMMGYVPLPDNVIEMSREAARHIR
jgi:phosphate transport system substrate-binding protein